jgi:hypothetical protein
MATRTRKVTAPENAAEGDSFFGAKNTVATSK